MAGRHHLLLLVVAGAPLPAVAQVAAAPAASGIVAAPSDPLGEISVRQRMDEERCRGGDADAVVVCGRLSRRGAGYRIPYAPESGARVRLIAGEAPSAMRAMGAGGCLRLCLQPVTINLFDPGSIGRGIDRILAGD